jgi:putative transposase
MSISCMPNYRRAWCPGGTCFFTVDFLQRSDNDLLVRHIDLFREAVRSVRQALPFTIRAWVVLPEHMHCVIELPDEEWRFATRLRRGERGIWQRRYWEHLIRDDQDFAAHMDYVHVNPLKHGLVRRAADWRFSTFHHLMARGVRGGAENSDNRLSGNSAQMRKRKARIGSRNKTYRKKSHGSIQGESGPGGNQGREDAGRAEHAA